MIQNNSKIDKENLDKIENVLLKLNSETTKSEYVTVHDLDVTINKTKQVSQDILSYSLNQQDLVNQISQELNNRLQEEIRRQNLIGSFNSSLLKINFPKFPNKTKNIITNWVNKRKYRIKLKEFRNTVSNYKWQETQYSKPTSNKYIYDLLEDRGNYAIVNNKFIQTFYLVDKPERISPNILSDLLNSGIELQMSKHFQPEAKAQLIKLANTRKAVLEAEHAQDMKQGKTENMEKIKEYQDTVDLLQRIINGDELGFLMGFYVTISANSLEDLRQQTRTFKKITEENELVFNLCCYSQNNALKSVLPLGQDFEKEKIFITTSEAVNFTGLLTRHINDENGLYLGRNSLNGSLVLLDPFASINNNMAIIGASGSGKSVTAKVLILRLLVQGIQSIIIDPQGEYSDLISLNGGEVFEFNQQNGINIFDLGVNPTSQSIDRHINVLVDFFKFFIEPSRYDSSYLNRILTEFYKSKKPRNFDALLEFVEAERSDWMVDFEKLTKGSLKGVFTSDKRINLDNILVSFNLFNLDDKIKVPAMFILSSLINESLLDAERKNMLIVDEAYLMFEYETTANFLIRITKTARKFNSGVVIITQDPQDFDAETTKKILTQCSTQIILKQSDASIKFLADNGLFALTSREINQLPTFDRGQAIIVRNGERMMISVEYFANEKELVETSPKNTEEVIKSKIAGRQRFRSEHLD